MKTVTDIESFFEALNLSNDLLKKTKRQLESSLMPFKVSDYYINTIKRSDPKHQKQLINIVTPPAFQKIIEGRIDPYGNTKYRDYDNHFIQHKYEKTLLIHLIDSCISNCQFCYKANEIRQEKKTSFQVDRRVEIASQYLKSTPEIDNILISGGDPFALNPNKLVDIIDKLIIHKSIRIIRLATKALVFDPEIFENEILYACLKRINQKPGKQVTIIVHINHPSEITDDVIRIIKHYSSFGVQFRGQPTIIKGVNDDVEVLTELQRKFLDLKIISYYLTVFMPIKGVEQYAISLDRAYKLVNESKKQLNGLEKKGVLLASHDFGKFEICGFYPSIKSPDKIILKWHQATKQNSLPNKIRESILHSPGDILFLDYIKGQFYCIDDVFKYNGIIHMGIGGEIEL